MERSNEYDVLIIGGGPAGSTCGKYLAEANISCTILDKAKFPRKKVCAAGLLQHVFTQFPYTAALIDVYNKSVQIYDADLDNHFEVHSDKPLLAMTKGREHFDTELLKFAQDAGCIVHEDTFITSVVRTKDGVIAKDAKGQSYNGKVIVGADSVPSVVGKSLNFGLTKKNTDFGIALEKEIDLSPEICDKYFGEERKVILILNYRGSNGYAWLFPRKSSVNIGIGGASYEGRNLSAHLVHLFEDLKEKQIIPSKDKHDVPITGHDKMAAILPVTIPKEFIFTDRALLIGDAGGFCSPATGEGIFYAMKSGQIAANCIEKIHQSYQKHSCTENPYTSQELRFYYRTIKTELQKELKFQHYAMENVITDLRRAKKAVRWGKKDKKLRDLFASFLSGSVSYDRLPLIMGYQYFRCKIKEFFGKL